MSREPKIITYDGIDQFPVELPWKTPSDDSVRVYFTFSDGTEEETKDFTINNCEVTLTRKPDCVKAVTVACVPCPEIYAPKFGSIENEVIVNAFNQMLDYITFLEARIDRTSKVAFGSDVDKWDGMVAGYKCGNLVPVAPYRVYFERNGFAGINTLQEERVEFCKGVIVAMAAFNSDPEYPWPYENENLGAFSTWEVDRVEIVEINKPDLKNCGFTGWIRKDLGEFCHDAKP